MVVVPFQFNERAEGLVATTTEAAADRMKEREAKAMTLRLPSIQAAELEKVAQIEDRPVSETIRTAIDEYIEKRRDDPEFQANLKRILDHDREILRRLRK
jgi:predicted DNA-binding protein